MLLGGGGGCEGEGDGGGDGGAQDGEDKGDCALSSLLAVPAAGCWVVMFNATGIV